MPIPPKTTTRREILLISAVLALVSALAYLPLAHCLGYYYDDWYLVYSGFTQGTHKFFEIFAIDRPARAWLVSAAYRLFGTSPLLYSLSAWALRLAASLSLLWTLRIVFPAHKQLTFFAVVLFTIYPGFLDMPNAIDYQSHIAAFACAMLSIALTVKLFHTSGTVKRIILAALSLLLTLAYLYLMEYYIGIEGFRLLLVLYLARKERPLSHLLHTTVRTYLPAGLAAGWFLVWRMFLFDNQRAATDISGMFSSIAGSPLRLMWLVVHSVQDFLNTTLLAWGVPLYQIGFRLRLRDTLAGAGVALLALGVLAGGLYLLSRRSSDYADDENPAPEPEWGRTALLIGGLSVLISLLPVELGDRHVVFPTFGRFTITGTPGAALFLAGILFYLQRFKARLLLVMLLAGTAVFTHYANAANFVLEWESVRSFWWQASWRAPQIEPGTLLLADYPNSGIFEDYFIWSPANLIYYPEQKSDTPTPITLPAAVLDRGAVNAVLQGGAVQEVERRSLLVQRDFSNFLLLSMPTGSSCLHTVNGTQPELSEQETYEAVLIAGRSNLKTVLTDAEPHQPPAAIFGAEPAHTWCYFYQKADLARQQGRWEEVTRLGDEAMALKEHPVDYVEWFPFVQAYAYLGREDKLAQIMPIINESAYLSQQGCRLFSEDAAGNGALYPDGQQMLVDAFCR